MMTEYPVSVEFDVSENLDRGLTIPSIHFDTNGSEIAVYRRSHIIGTTAIYKFQRLASLQTLNRELRAG
jgi:hypothetical protein